MTLHSRYGEPFRATLVVVPTEDDETSVRVRVGDREEYRRLEATWWPNANQIEVTETEVRGDVWIVQLASQRAFNDLVLDLVIVLESRRSMVARNYPLLFDLPGPSPEPELAQSRTVELPPIRSRDPEPAPDPAPPTARPRESIFRQIRPEATTWAVTEGQTLLEIAATVAGDRPFFRVANEIFALNERAFVDGNPDLLRAGAELILPKESAAERRTQLELTEPPARHQLIGRLDEWLDTEPVQLPDRDAQIRRDIAFARSETETTGRTNEQLRERINLLENRIDDLQRLIALKDEVAEEQREALIALSGDRGLRLREDPILSLPVFVTEEPAPLAAVTDAPADPAADPASEPEVSTGIDAPLPQESEPRASVRREPVIERPLPAARSHTPNDVTERRRRRELAMITVAVVAILAVAIPPLIYRRKRPAIQQVVRQPDIEELRLPDGL